MGESAGRPGDSQFSSFVAALEVVVVVRTCCKPGMQTVLVYAEADRHIFCVNREDEACHIGPSNPGKCCLNSDALPDAARQSGADILHPGCNFLSENTPRFSSSIKALVAKGSR